jgi:RND family efflux transporter MFP subunit
MRPILKFSSFLFSLFFLTSTLASAQMPKPVVRVSSVEEHVVQDRYRVIGTLKAVSRSEIAAREDGAVIEVKVNEGQTVKKDAVLAVLDARRIEATLKEAQAQLSMAKSMIRQREVELSRAEVDNKMKAELYADKAIAERVFLDAEREFRVAETQLQSSRDGLTEVESRIELLNVRLEDMKVRAPFDGTILAQHIESGEWVMPGNPLFTLINSGQIEAWLDVPERFSEDITKYARELTIAINATNDQTPSTSLRTIPEIDPRARTFKLIATIANAENRLAPGMSVTAWIPTSMREKRLLVDKDALIRRQAGDYLFKIVGTETEGYRATQIPVTVLFELGQKIALKTNALTYGEYVIIEGNERLMPETAVDISIQKEKTA